MEEAGPTATSTWWQRAVSKEADRERLGAGERGGNLIGAAFIAAFVLVVRYLQDGLLDGFFTSGFGAAEQAAFYGSMLFGTVPNLARALTGRRNIGRLVEVLSAAVSVASWSYLLTVFPFDFGQLVALLPAGIQGSFGGAVNGLFRLLIVIGMVISVLGAAYAVVMYFYVWQELRGRGLRR